MTARTLADRVVALLKKPEFIAPMAALTVRFRGRGHVGKSVLAALDLVLADAPTTTTWRGRVLKGAKDTRYASPRALSAAGFRPVREALASTAVLPKGAFQVYAADAASNALAPRTFAFSFSLAKRWEDTFATPGGLFCVAWPLEALEDPTHLLHLGNRLVTVLGASWATLGPAVWLAPHCLFNSSSNEIPERVSTLIELFGVHPQLDAPHLYASRWPHTADEVEPDLMSGLLAPSWTTWLEPKLAKKVPSFPGAMERSAKFTRYQLSAEVPFEMTEAPYAAWRAGWQALAPVRLKTGDQSVIGRFFRNRLEGETQAALLEAWRAAERLETAKAQRAIEFARELRRLREAESAQIVEVANAARGVLEPGALCWDLIPSLTELIAARKVEPAVGLVWLDFAEEQGVWAKSFQRDQTAKAAAGLAVAAGSSERAFGLLKLAFTDHREKYVPPAPARKRELARDPRFAALRKLPAWKKLVAL